MMCVGGVCVCACVYAGVCVLVGCGIPLPVLCCDFVSMFNDTSTLNSVLFMNVFYVK